MFDLRGLRVILLNLMDVENFAQQIYEKFQTRDVFEIAAKAGVKIVYEKWYPVTLGEFDRRTKTIIVNNNAEMKREKIIAHELGHYFFGEFKIEDVADEEIFCDQFAEELLKTKFSRGDAQSAEQ